MRRSLLPLIVGVVLVLAAPVGAAARSPKAGGPHACSVVNVGTGTVYSNKSLANPVQTAIDAAASGATLNISGRCIGNFVLNHDLTLQGVGTRKNPMATLDGNGVRPLTVAGVVLDIRPATTVTVRNLRITGGSNEPDGGGISSWGTLNLIDSDVSGNAAFSIPPGQATRGGGIWSFGTLNVTNSRISNNSSGGWGGGIYNDGGTVSVTGSTISNNTGAGGGIFNNHGTVTLTNTTVSGNADYGIENGGGTLTLVGSTVSGNTGTSGGGIVNESDGTVVLSGATMVQSNTSFFNGGGIFNQSGTVSTSGWTGAVSGNSPDNCEPAMTLGSSSCT